MKRQYIVCFALLLSAATARAQSCNFTISSLAFGTVNLSNGSAVDATATLTANCTGKHNQTIRVCPNFGSGTGNNNSTASVRYLINGTTTLNYNLYQDAGHTAVWGSYVWAWPPRPPSIDIDLNKSGSGSGTATIYGRIFSEQTTVPPGVYVSAFSGGHTLISYDYAPSNNCSKIGSSNGKQVPFTVSATNQASCTVSATDLNFGSTGSLSSVVDSTNSISIKCTNGTAYTVSLSGGLSGAMNPTLRHMTSTLNSEYVTYGIYRDASRTQEWGSTLGTNTASAIGIGVEQNFLGYGRVPVQTTPSAQSYTDTIIVTVTY